MDFDATRWRDRLARWSSAAEVPGAVLAVLADGAVHEVATGVLNVDTGAPVSSDSLFQLGSLSKVYTATIVQRLVDAGRVALDTPVRAILPEFRLSEAAATDAVTVRHLLTHTSGIDGDFFHDTGRGDDCLARYVAACADLPLVHPVGAGTSYSNAAFSIAGRVVEALTGTTWDAALSSVVLAPLGVSHTVTLPEQALRYATAIGHEDGKPVPQWGFPRSTGPAGGVLARAGDVLAFVAAHLRDDALAPMREPQAEVPTGWAVQRRGLGWQLYDWAGRAVFGHDGETLGQYAYLRVVPDRGVAAVLLTNGGEPNPLYQRLFGELLGELAGVTLPRLAVPAVPPRVDPAPYAGTYRNVVRAVRVEAAGGGLRVHSRYASELSPPQERDLTLVPLRDNVFVDTEASPSAWHFLPGAHGRYDLFQGGRLLPRAT
jgi:CubicO group peptidase (beta-lactamase class C family)